MLSHATSNARADCKTEFLRKLHNMVELADLITSPPAVHWSPQGDGLIIRDKTQFYKHVLPLFFPNVNKQGSFTRKFNRNGMFKVLSGPEKGIWRHKDGKFFRGSHGVIGCEVASQPTTELTGSLGSMQYMPRALPVIDEFASSTPSTSLDSTGFGIGMRSASPQIDNNNIEADLGDFFHDLENSITDEMIGMTNHDHLALVRMGGKTVMAEMSK